MSPLMFSLSPNLQDMQPLRLFPQPGHAARTSPVRHGKRGLGSTDEGRDTGETPTGS